jgi:penicillin amidase
MTLRLVRISVAALALLLGLVVGASGIGPLPPLGFFLDPVRGAWAAGRIPEPHGEIAVDVPGLRSPVDVRYDARGVPHIFARSIEDATRALGYVVARDRLFQLDLAARAGSGRLTELVGAVAVDADSVPRHLGMSRAAEQKLAAIGDTTLVRRLLEAYADGVNAHVDALAPAEWPVEYKLLGARPSRWEPINTLQTLARMSWVLTYVTGEHTRQAARAMIGRAATEALFPIGSLIHEPIQPVDSGMPRFDSVSFPPPGAGETSALTTARALSRFASPPWSGDDDRTFASNNWAVSPRRTQGGYALLAGDPHLELTLPSVWYEVHMVVPGELDAYGVTIPGLLGPVIGFTRDIAWSFTNTGADVLDFYAETVDDSLRPTRYRLDGAWRDLERRVEEYRGRAGEVLHTDTVRYTHRGPMQKDGRAWLSMRWTALEPSNEIQAFAVVGRGRSAREFLDAMAQYYFVPAQNMIVADRGGSIAIRSTGHYPIRPDSGHGLEIRDGSSSANDWQGYWPVAEYPQSIDPPHGFLASANQEPIDPRVARRYLGFEFGYEPWRALNINRLLRADSSVTVDAMRRYQTHPGSMRAELLVPYFLDAARADSMRRTWSATLDTAARLLGEWDRTYTAENERTALFEASLRQLASKTWDELAPDGGRRVATPTTQVLLALLRDPASVWWDARATGGREDRDQILRESLVAAYDSLVRHYGPPGPRWAWGNRGPASVRHLLGLPGFSALELPVQGGPGTLNPSGARFGSSWRMVVELGPDVRAWGIYPGGQSGNPASPRYRDRIGRWQKGELDTLAMPRRPTDLEPATVRLTLTPPGSP